MCDFFSQERIIHGESTPHEEGCQCEPVKLRKLEDDDGDDGE